SPAQDPAPAAARHDRRRLRHLVLRPGRRPGHQSAHRRRLRQLAVEEGLGARRRQAPAARRPRSAGEEAMNRPRTFHPRRGCTRVLRACAILGLLLPGACSYYTGISRESNGDYVVTGIAGGTGFVWICSYDPQTMTLTVKRKLPE